MKLIKKLAITAGVALAIGSAPAMAGTPGCMGKMWNPLTDLDFTLMGALKVGGTEMMKAPKFLGKPPRHKADTVCFCEDGLKSGFGTGMTYWLPAYLNDVSRQAGCLGFVNGVNILPGFLSLSSAQTWGIKKDVEQKTTNMQIHYAFADIISIAGKELFEQCGSLTSGLKVSYLTEPDFVFQNDVYSAMLSPQVALLATIPLLTQIACGGEAMANTLGGWYDIGICGWESARYPLSNNVGATNSAQVTNMEITLKYLTRASILGTNLRTYGKDVQCEPKYAPFYDPFQHRYQWSFPTKTSTRYNQNMVLWGTALRSQSGSQNFNEVFAGLGEEANQITGLDTGETGSENASNSSSSSDSGTDSSEPATGESISSDIIATAETLFAKVPKPLNYPTKEAGYMQVWEAKSCCLVLFDVVDIALLIATMGQSLSAEMAKFAEIARKLDKVYDAYKFVSSIASTASTAMAFAGMLAGSMAAEAGSAGLAESATDVEGETKGPDEPPANTPPAETAAANATNG